MRFQDLKNARLRLGWGQAEVAERLGVSQTYVHMLEQGKRRLTPELTRRLALVYQMSPVELPITAGFRPSEVDAQWLAESLAKLDYPGFAYLRSRVAKKNPGEVLLIALAQDRLEARLAEALPWLLFRYSEMDVDWLAEQARTHNLQNRLGFVTGLAVRLSKRDATNAHTTAVLTRLESLLDHSRLVHEDAFPRPPKNNAEREWLTVNRPPEAAHWNLLTDLRPEHLQYAG
jgi:transcriptional regulator with XRE-family HTH domain